MCVFISVYMLIYVYEGPLAIPDPHLNLVSNLLFSFTAQKVADVGMDTRGAFKMAVWLSVYYDFFEAFCIYHN